MLKGPAALLQPHATVTVCSTQCCCLATYAWTVPIMNRQDVELLLDWRPVLGMLRSGKQVVA